MGEVTTVSCEVTNALLPGDEPARLEPGNVLFLESSTTVPPSAAGTLVNQVKVEGGGAATVTAEAENEASTEDAKAGFEEFEAQLTGPDGLPVTGADSHPYQYTTSFAVNTITEAPGSGQPVVAAEGNLREIEVTLPPGLVGNPTAIERCTAQQFNTNLGPASAAANECPGQLRGGPGRGPAAGRGSRVGGSVADLQPRPAERHARPVRLPRSRRPLLHQHQPALRRRLRDHRLPRKRDRGHAGDRLAGDDLGGSVGSKPRHPAGILRVRQEGSCPVAEPPRPFFRLPSSCQNPLLSTMSFETWAQPSASAATSFQEPAPTACNQPDFSPTVEAKPSTNVADAPSGLHVDVHLPQKDNEDPEGLGEADLRDATVTLPPGLTVNPSSANGLAACSLAQIGYQGIKEGKPSFSTEPANCPDASKIGTVAIETPLVDHPIPGSIYLAKQSENPFGSLLALYIAVNDPITGVVIKLPGKVEADPVTGQITNVFEQNPQLPFEDLKVDLFNGARAPLAHPADLRGIGHDPDFTTTTSLVPWTAPEGATAHPTDSFAMAQSPSGGPCAATAAQLPNAPSFEAGTRPPAGRRLLALPPTPKARRRLPGTQGPQRHPAPGPDRQARRHRRMLRGRSRPGPEPQQPRPRRPRAIFALLPGLQPTGHRHRRSRSGPIPLLPPGQRLPSRPLQRRPTKHADHHPRGRRSLRPRLGSGKGRPERRPRNRQGHSRLRPDPDDPQGIPIDVRSIAVKIDRPDFTLNPTGCEAMAHHRGSDLGNRQRRQPQNRFQVGGCSNLGFKPKLLP